MARDTDGLSWDKMTDKKKSEIEDLSIHELEQLLYRKKRGARRQRLRRLRENGRVVVVDGISAPTQQAATNGYPAANRQQTGSLPSQTAPKSKRGKSITNKLLLFVEITAVLGLLFIFFTLWTTQQELNQELTQVQRAEVAALGPPTPTAAPVIDLVVLPTGHRYIDGRSPEAVESGDIPAHLLPALQAYQPPPIPTASPIQAQVIQIPAIGVNHPIVEGAYDWEQLKRGVAHHIESAQPGQTGNMVLAAHNDIYGAIFKDLDQLSPGDEIIVSTNQTTYTYVISKIDIVEPTDVSVLEATDYSSTTLISCYPYRINTHRIVVFADLVTDTSG